MSLETFFARIQHGHIPSVEESMGYEALRLATFHICPRLHNASACKLANAGFYYTGQGDAVTCFQCGVRIGDWASIEPYADPLALHKKRSPHCPFFSENESGNIPYIVDDSHLNEQAKKLKQHILARAAGNGSRERPPPPTRDDQSQASLSTQNQPDAQQGSGQREPEESATPLLPPHEQLFDSLPQLPVFDSDVQNAPNYKEEEARLGTFTYWPNRSSVRPTELAKAGFYYLGTEDRVQCAFCKGVLRNWEPTDYAMDMHKKHFPACPFLSDPQSAGNVPVTSQFSGVRLRKDIPEDEALKDYILKIMTEKAYHPHMAMKAERVNSFENFFSDSRRTPEEFAEAGFYFTGQGDNVKCFFCDGGLRNWERNDDPWLEHARWFPKCGYLLTKKGEEYVKEIRKKYSPPGTEKPRLRKLKRRHVVRPEVLEEFMRSEMVQEAMDIGYPISQIKATALKRLEELGSLFPSLESLLDAILEDEELIQLGVDTDNNSNTSSGEDSPEAEKAEGIKSASGETSEKNGKRKVRKRNRKKKKDTTAAHVNPVELMSDEKGSALMTEVQKLKDERTCKVCLDSEVNIVFLKCGHLVCCSDCAPAMRHCPICRQAIRGTIRVFLS